MSTSDGGPAYPVPGLQHDHEFNGMSMRDHFAGIAMHALMMDAKRTAECAAESGTTPGEFLAATAYEAADMMLAERAKVKA